MRGIYSWAKAGAKLEICTAEIFGLGRILDASRDILDASRKMLDASRITLDASSPPSLLYFS